MLANEETKIVQIFTDIQRCLDKSRVDQQIIFFIHIYETLDDNVRNHDDIKKVYDFVKARFDDYDFRKELEFYYALIEGEEGRMLFDPTISYTAKYDMDNFITTYKIIDEVKVEIARALGLIKRQMLVSKGDILGNW